MMFGFLHCDVTKARFLVVSGLVVLSLTDNMTMLVSDEIGLGQFIFMRSVVVLAALFIASRFMCLHIWPKNWRAVLVRALILALSVYLLFATFAFVPVAIAGAGLNSSPIFVLIFSALFLKIIPGIRRIGAVILGSVGVWLILDPSAHDFHSLQLLTICAGALYAIAGLLTRHYCSGESPYSLLASFTIAIGLLGILNASLIDLLGIMPTSPQAQFLLTGWEMPNMHIYLWLIVIGVLAGLGVGLISAGYQYAETSYVAIYEYSYLISAGFFGWLIWDNLFDAYDLLGMAMIIATGVIISRTRYEEG